MAVVAVLLVLTAACSDDDSGGPDPGAAAKRYVALGDSFPAGGGAPPYGARRAVRAGLAPRPRSGARSGRVGRGAGVRRRVGRPAPRHRVRGAASAQVPDEPDGGVALVTISIGANDAAAVTAIAVCAALDCSPYATSVPFTAALAQLTARLVDEVYPALRAAYPNAQLVHVGYPRLTPALQ